MRKKVVVCPKCGIVKYYVNTDIQKVYIGFDAYGNEVEVPIEPTTIRASYTNKCICGRKVKIKEIEEDA